MRSRYVWCVVIVLAAAAPPLRAGAQSWNSTRAQTLVRQATDRRVQQLADSGLLDYRASAHGYVTFLAQLGEGFRLPPRVVKADELALEVYWRAPNLSKQRIVGRRDTTLLPTDIAYHRDHLGIVQNNFPAIIRIGEGDEVRDVPHPLSEEGLRQYEFALTDSLRITIPGLVIDVYELRVRPIDDRQPRIAGAVYIERSSAQVVRMAFGFTRAAYLDKQLEDVFVVLENGLVDTRYWLPRRQEVEIRRTLTWMEYPVRGIIRGRWEIGDYALNIDAPRATFIGPEIVESPREVLQSHAWPPGRLVDSLPRESQLPTPTEIRRVQQEARALVRRQATPRSRGMLAVRGASDFVRFDRNAGLSVGAGFALRFGRAWTLTARGSQGMGDRRGHGTWSIGWRDADGNGLSFFTMDDVRDAGDVAERSTLVNSLAAQEFESDYTDLYGVRAGGFVGTMGWAASRWTATWALENTYDLGRHASSFRGALAPSFAASPRQGATVTLRVVEPATPGWLGTEWRGDGEARVWTTNAVGCFFPTDGPACGPGNRVERIAFNFDVERAVGPARVVARAFGGLASGESFLRSQDLFFLGGPTSAPGFSFHKLVGDRALSQTLEVQVPVSFPAVSFGRFGHAPASAALAPHWTVVGLHSASPSTIIARGTVFTGGPDPLRPFATGWYHSAGVSLIGLFDLIRIDASRALPHGRWMFSVDVTRPFWSIL